MRHQRHPKAGVGAWQTLLHLPIVNSVRLPKEAAGRGRTSTLRPRNLDEEEAQQKERAKTL